MTILHIEDHHGITEAVRMLCDDSIYIDSVHSLANAKAHLKVLSYDLLLIDLNLGDSRGMETIKALKDYRIPIIVLTADPTEHFATTAVKLGVADYISKHVLTSINLPVRLNFVLSKSRTKVTTSTLKWEGFELLKPYLACAVLA